MEQVNVILRNALILAYKVKVPIDTMTTENLNECRRFISKKLASGDKPPVIEITLALQLAKKISKEFDLHEYQKLALGSERELAVEEKYPFLSTGFSPIGTDISQVRIMGDSITMDTTNKDYEYANAHLIRMFGISNPYNAVAIFNPQNLKRKEYLLLDSRYAEDNIADRTKFRWYYTGTAAVESGSVNTTDKIRDITAIRILAFSLNRRYEYGSQRVTVLIEELSAQSFIAADGHRFHFFGRMIRDPSVTSADTFVFVDFDERDNLGIYRFRQPIVSLNSITISVGIPYAPIQFLQARFYNCTADFTGYPASFTIDAPIAHNFEIFSTIEVLYVEYFTTTNPTADAFNIGYITKIDGHKAVGLNILFPQRFYITNNFTYAGNSPAGAYPAFVGTPSNLTIYASNPRLFIHLEVEFIDPNCNISLPEITRMNAENS